jgi:hypothetical protein
MMLGVRMQRILPYFLTILVAFGPMAHANDKSSTYQLGTYIASSAVGDGTITDNFNCGSPSFTGTTVCSGGVADNQVMIYRIRVAQGIWSLETYRQASDSAVRQTFGDQPPHLMHEKENPLDFLKNGERVVFRVETHKKLLGVETDIFVPFADNPNKETKFVGTFFPHILPEKPSPPSDNVRAMCDAHKLSPELERQFCTQPVVPLASANVGIGQTSDSETTKASPAAAASLANEGHVLSPLELAERVQTGEASRCAVVTVPAGAKVWIDGLEAGVSPMAFVLMRQGDKPRSIRITLNGYRTVEKQVIPDGKTIPIGLTLEPN